MYKLIVVEDEPLLRDGIARYIRRSEPEITVTGSVGDGEEACRLVRETKPDIILTDINMPKLDGLQFIELIREVNPLTEIVIISGYADFTYAQKAIQLKVREYLLKPVSPEDIHDLLERLRRELDRSRVLASEYEQADSYRRQSLRLRTEKFFIGLVTGALPAGELVLGAHELDLELQADWYCVARVRIRPDGTPSGEDRLRELVADIAAELGEPDARLYAFLLSDAQPALLFCLSGAPEADAAARAVQMADDFLARLRRELPGGAWAVVGGAYAASGNIPRSFREATEGICLSVRADEKTLRYEEILTEQSKMVEKPEALEEKLIVHIKLGDREQSLRLTGELFAFFAAHDFSLSRIKQELIEVITILEREMEKHVAAGNCAGWASRIFSYEEIRQCADTDALRAWLDNFIGDCTRQAGEPELAHGEQMIRKARELIEICMGDENFTLSDVSSRLYISPNYLRQLFKQYTGMSFVEYLTRLRMERAASLLRDPTLKIQDIAERVGYTNQRYFAMCFKKYFDHTPTVYREINGGQAHSA